MGEKFVGSRDVVLHASGEETESGVGAYMDVAAEVNELDLEISAQTGGPDTVQVVTETGHVVATFSVPDTTDQSQNVSLGGVPGGRRVRAEWTIDTSLTFTLTARESRSGR